MARGVTFKAGEVVEDGGETARAGVLADEEQDAQAIGCGVDDHLVAIGGVHVEGGLAGGVEPQAVASGGHEEGDALVGGRAFASAVVHGDVADDGVGVVEGVEVLAETVEGGGIGDAEASSSRRPRRAS